MHIIDTPGKIDKINLNHGSGGKLMHALIDDLFVRYFANESLAAMGDAALLHLENKTSKLAFSTDSFVVDPLFFPGGDIGKLAVCGTVNDIAVSGARPLALSCGFIIEEGLSYGALHEVVKSMARTAEDAGVKIVTGDTKVVPKGNCDKLFINTAGIGSFKHYPNGQQTAISISAGDKIIVNGGIAEHGMVIMKVREGLPLDAQITSDCAPLYELIASLDKYRQSLVFMRDATRGGVATVLCELANQHKLSIDIYEEAIPIKDEVQGMCDLLGFDPLYVANEGKVVMVVKANLADKVLALMREHPLGKDAAIIGAITEEHAGKVVMETQIGGKRIVDMLAGDQLPRIC